MEDAAIKRATGKTKAQWLALLDKAGAKKMSHRDIAKMVQTKYLKSKAASNVVTNGGWWSQMITVEYERARGLRNQNQDEFGYMVSVHKTAMMSPQELLKAWSAIERSKPVAAKKLERLPSRSKRMQIRYKAKEGQVVVFFDARGGGKSRIAVEAVRLKSKSAVERERTFWKKMLTKIDSK